MNEPNVSNKWALLMFEKTSNIAAKSIELESVDLIEIRRIFNRPSDDPMDQYFYDLETEEQISYFENTLHGTLERKYKYTFINRRLLGG